MTDTTTTREILANIFKTGATPTASNFESLIHTATDASELIEGTLDNERLAETVEATNFKGSGAELIGLNADQLTTGTIDNSRLSKNLDLTEAGQILDSSITTNTIESNTIESNTIESNTIESNTIESNTITASVVNCDYLEGEFNIDMVSFTGTLQIEGEIVASGDITAFSDKRLKTNVQTISNALDRVTQLEGVTFERSDLANDKRYTGLIAQDVQRVLPEAVYDKEEYLSVAYGNMVGLLVESIKELNSKIDSLQIELAYKSN